MTIDWTHFTPGSAFAGDLLIGLAAAWLVLQSGHVLGASGLLAGSFRRARATGLGERRLRWD